MAQMVGRGIEEKSVHMEKKPGDRIRQHWDYINVKLRFRNSTKDVQAVRGADTDPDHNLLVGNICTKLKKIMKFQKGKQRRDLQKLHFRRKTQDTLEKIR